MEEKKKITWSEIYKSFRQSHPNLRKLIVRYEPRDYLTITIWFKDGSAMTYDYLTKRCRFVKD